MAISLNTALPPSARTADIKGKEDALLSRLGREAESGGTFADFFTAARETKKPVIDKTDRLFEQCKELEGILLKTLITGMRKTVEKSGLTQNSFAGDMYEDMLYDEYARQFTRNTRFGLAELAYLELTGQRGKMLALNKEGETV